MGNIFSIEEDVERETEETEGVPKEEKKIERRRTASRSNKSVKRRTQGKYAKTYSKNRRNDY